MGLLDQKGCEMSEVVVLIKTWQGPDEETARKRLAYLKETIASLDKHLLYPNLSWHIADDGSKLWYAEAVGRLLGDRFYTYTDSMTNGDIGRNMNMGLRRAFERAEIVLNWSDDIVLQAPLDIEPYVDLLLNEPSIGYIVTRPQHPSLRLTPLYLRERYWHKIEHYSPNRFLLVTSLNLMHRRAWDFYGPYPEGLRMDIMQEEMAWRYRHFKRGLEIVIPDDLIDNGLVSYGADSTWDWRLDNKVEQEAWYRYRSYSARLGNGR